MTAVLDASALAEYLLWTGTGRAVAVELTRHPGGLHLPHLAIVETASVLRGLTASGQVSAARARGVLDDLRDLPARRWPVEPFLARVWELRGNVTAYDATYVALAEALDGDLLTTDARLGRTLAGISSCRVVNPR